MLHLVYVGCYVVRLEQCLFKVYSIIIIIIIIIAIIIVMFKRLYSVE
jgi:hypothetical protein